ncbi:hypothetical protein FB461_2298 [Rarobacter faecitabidus]|uniref:Uncharacterized protein n=1 Tax=Rarobacter faecitabidus TaxID=13243 RepID=A0A542ZA09_RARFA|nr:hypothetical protein FB461_2298 [Rarobacter faecitabidus]
MCHPATCRTCGKTTWSGCGQHVDSVMRDVPKDQRCSGHDTPTRSRFFARILGAR